MAHRSTNVDLRGVRLRRKYKNPPVVEALVEMHFLEEEPDLTVAGRFYETWKDRTVKRELIQQFHVSFGPQAVSPQLPPRPTVRLWSEAPKAAVQVGPAFLSVHLLERPYPGQEVFRPMLEDALRLYRELTGPTGLAHVSMRYINKVDVPIDAEGSLKEWLVDDLAPEPPGSMAEGIASFAVQWVSLLRSGRGALTYALRSGGRNDAQEFFMDLAVQSGPEPGLDDLNEWLNEAHDAIVDAFEDSITDAAREGFGVFDAG